eukprot:scaffold57131_cov46-Phaeocystis_antarctica.AAC.2
MIPRDPFNTPPACVGASRRPAIPGSCRRVHGLSKARRTRVSSRTRPAWGPLCWSGVRALCGGVLGPTNVAV